MTEQKSEKLQCERCGAKFECGVETGDCWCFMLPVSQEVLKNLSDKFDGCLCPECLLENEQAAKQNF